jgi:tetratricopeptide (TPR) repeat protein
MSAMPSHVQAPAVLIRSPFARSGLLLVALLFSLATVPAAAQNACEEELRQAQEHYEFGRFERAITLLNRCLERGDVPQDERERAYRLIGLSYLGQDVLEQARENVRQLLRIAPNYQPNPVQDPPPFRELVAQERQRMGLDQAARDDDPPSEPVADDDGGIGIGKWLLIGGGVVVAAAAAVLLLSGGDDDDGDDPPGPTTLDEAEPNDAPAQAQRLEGVAPLTLNGSAETQDVGEIGVSGDFGFDDVEDFFRITTTQPGATFRLDGFSADCDLYLLDPVADAQGTFNIIAVSGNANTTPEVIAEAQLPAGTYLIGVSIFDPAFTSATQTNYTLTVEAALTGSGVQAARRAVLAGATPDVGATFRLVPLTGTGQTVARMLRDGATSGPVGLFREDGQGLTELDPFEESTTLPAGRGAWVRTSTPLQVSAAAPALPLTDRVAIPVQPGWNIITNPYDVPLAWSAVQQANDLTQGLWQWEGHFSRAAALPPAHEGEAFYVLNDTGRETLILPRPDAAIRGAAQRPDAGLTLSVSRGGRLQSAVRVGFATDASPGRDAHDQFAPPGYFEGASLRVVGSEGTFGGLLAEDYRSWTDAAARFDLHLTAPPHTPLLLEADGLAGLPGYAATLIDEVTGTAYDLADGTPVPLVSPEDTRRFTLVLGTQAAVEVARQELLPTTISLSNYPNPFTERTTVRYTLPEGDDVQLVVYDLLGRAVQHLVDGYQEAGQHEVVVDGSTMPSGTYVYRLRAGETVETGRFVRVR